MRWKKRLRELQARALAVIRTGPNSVLWTNDGMRGGNLLYYWLHAFAETTAGRPTRVLYQVTMDPWLRMFPALEDLTIDQHQLGLRDRRRAFWDPDVRPSAASGTLGSFIEKTILSSPSFTDRLHQWSSFLDTSTAVLNIRRGDYLDARYFEEYAMHVPDYFGQAERVLSEHSDSQIALFVSDDISWCHSHKGELTTLTFAEAAPDRFDMFDDLAALAATGIVVLSNSTFAYWGGLIGDLLSPDRLVVAPRFHSRLPNGYLEWPHPQHWVLVDNRFHSDVKSP
ncbi:alpha-1,2-fucosyltransferase [Micrococcus terreus]|uniref:alpha-1,2-fucosyltransferase n=1 Tax=Micrococcus terreus TaxID=574650 RepID=UPI0023F7135E|nr:alpha-1,2-fucosyltransferase [Micrococcus terreus]